MLRLYVDHRRKLVEYANGILRDPGRAEDVVQESFLRFRSATTARLLDEPRPSEYSTKRCGVSQQGLPTGNFGETWIARACSPVDVLCLAIRMACHANGHASPPSGSLFLRDWIRRLAPDNVPAGQIGIGAEPVPPREAGAAPVPVPTPLSFANDIRPLFRDKDRKRMLFKFDLFSHDDVKLNAPDILDAVSSGRMPCDTPWDGRKIELFKQWMDAGFPA